MASGDRGDHAVDHPSRSDTKSRARPVDPCRGVETDDGIEPEHHPHLAPRFGSLASSRQLYSSARAGP